MDQKDNIELALEVACHGIAVAGLEGKLDVPRTRLIL